MCDFDGTVSPTDIGAALVEHFTPVKDPQMDRLLAQWRAGEIGHRALTEAECRGMRMDEEAALAFTRRFDLDPHFASFVADVEARGERVMVASEGLHFYIRDLLERAGLARVSCASNVARFADGGVVPEFPNAGRGCGRCGNCKGELVRDQQRAGFEVVFVGDGVSDRCGARAANHVLARGSLLEWCAAQAIPAHAFRDFSEVRSFARGLRVHAAPEGS